MIKLNSKEINREVEDLKEACKSCNSKCYVCKKIEDCLYFIGDELMIKDLEDKEIRDLIKSNVIDI